MMSINILVASWVVVFPPISRVRIVWPTACSMADTISCAAACSPICSNIKASGSEAGEALFTAEASLDLHRAEAEAYAENLASSEPAIYVVLRQNEADDENNDVDIDIHLAEISLSPYNIQDYEDCGEDQIEKLPLQGPIANFVKEFVDIHFQ